MAFTKMKLCIDCKWCEKGWTAHCVAPQNTKITPVTGDKYYRWTFCDNQRDDSLIVAWVLRTCGRRARWFEPKEV